jgi:hypothetical protein
MEYSETLLHSSCRSEDLSPSYVCAIQLHILLYCLCSPVSQQRGCTEQMLHGMTDHVWSTLKKFDDLIIAYLLRAVVHRKKRGCTSTVQWWNEY